MAVQFTRRGSAPSGNAPSLGRSQGLSSDLADIAKVQGFLETKKEKSKLEKRRAQWQSAFQKMLESDKPFDEKQWGFLASIDPKTTKQSLEVMSGIREMGQQEQEFVLKGAQKASDMVGRFLLSVRQIEDPRQRQQLILGRLAQMREHENPLVREAGATLQDDFRSMAQESQNRGAPFTLDDNMIDVLLSRYSIFGDIFKHEAETRAKMAGETAKDKRAEARENRLDARAEAREDRLDTRAATRENRLDARELERQNRLDAREGTRAINRRDEAATAHTRGLERDRMKEVYKRTGGVTPLTGDSPEMSMLPGAVNFTPSGPGPDSPLAAIRAAAGRPAATSAQGGELGTLTRPDGGESTELSVTVTDERLNGGKPTNIPLLVRGQTDVDALLSGREATEAQLEHAIKRAEQRVRGGGDLPGYETVEEAVQAARQRSNRKGMAAH